MARLKARITGGAVAGTVEPDPTEAMSVGVCRGDWRFRSDSTAPC